MGAKHFRVPSRIPRAHVGAILAFLLSCKGGDAIHKLDPTWSRMMEQPRGDAFGRTPVFADGMVMRTPPDGTRPIEAHETPGKTEEGKWVDTLPTFVTRDAIDRGHARFDQFCAPCHGFAGDGKGPVAAKLPLRRPPDYEEPRIAAISPGEIHDVIRDGYGFMPSYASKLDDDDRWAVAGYVLALRRSRHAVVRDLPDDVRAELAREAP